MDAALFDDEMSDVLGLLAAPDSQTGIEMDWLLDKNQSSGDEGSPPRKNQRLASPERPPPALPNMTEATRSLAQTNEERLINVSSVSGSMAQGRPQPALGDMSTISTSLAHLGMLRQCNQAALPANPPQPPPPKSPRLANASTISRNLASVGAAPQCNQRHVSNNQRQDVARADAVIGGGVVAEAVPLAPARVVAAPSTEEAQEVGAETLSTRPPPPRRRSNDEDEKLRLRRARNREAAERMRRRRRDEREELQKNVRELTARVADLEVRNSDLEGRLAAAEAENARLRGGAVAPGAQAVAEAPALAVKLRRRARG